MTVAKKADSLYPCVSAASICAKVEMKFSSYATFFYQANHASLIKEIIKLNKYHLEISIRYIYL